MNRINIHRIIIDHFKTLKSLNQSHSYISLSDSFLFLIIPIAIATFLALNNYTYEKYLSDLIALISILGGFLFNLLIVIYSQIENIKKDILELPEADRYRIQIKNKFISEIHINISFSIVLAIILLLFLLSTTIEIPSFLPVKFIHYFIVAFSYFLMILFTLTLLMIISRIYILFKKET